nr:hypothetical protein [Tanacetum cinerariifolium]
MGATYALLRRGEDLECGMLCASSVGLSNQQLHDLKNDPEVVALRRRVNLGPRVSELIPYIFSEIHGGVIGGHEGIQKTYQRLSRKFFWVGLRRDEDLTMDFIDGLAKSMGYSVIMVVVDHLSKSAHFAPLKHLYTVASVATMFVREIIQHHGDDPEAEYDYHPQTDGQFEVVNQSLETCLRCFGSSQPKEWVKWLSWAEYWYNTSYHSAIRTTPFKVLHGRDPPSLITYDRGTTLTLEVDQYLQERDQILEELKRQFLRAQRMMKE